MTTLFLATTGGHLHQLDELAARLPSGPAIWVTHSNAQSRSLLADREVVYVPYVRPRHLLDVVGCVPTARRLLRTRDLTRVVSTGSVIALGYLPYLAAHGVACHYIESAARVGGPSRTGRILQRARGIRVYTQYQQWADRRWSFAGSVFDAYSPVSRTPTAGPTLRVVVTVGTAQEYPFRRMIERLVPLLATDGELTKVTGMNVDVLWQTGATQVDGLSIEATPFLTSAELATALAEADVVVSHAGAGSALAALAAGRAPVLVDRRQKFAEAPDDHQRQLADELSRRGLAQACSAETVSVDNLLRSMTSEVRRSGESRPLALLA
ncbi:MAG: glycosyltransferase family 28 [Pseudonocardia sp.]|nr:glycosyltransferase family 28 [Pseudonocardia sp.]